MAGRSETSENTRWQTCRLPDHPCCLTLLCIIAPVARNRCGGSRSMRMAQRPENQRSVPARVSTGIPGLDEVLAGGYSAHRLHLVEGAPGTGKTTLALQFLLEGVRQGETVLYGTLSETIEELQAVARSHGWDLTGICPREFAPTEESLTPEEQYTILHPADVELGETTWAVLEEGESTKPARVVFASLAELRVLARDPLRYRRQVLG